MTNANVFAFNQPATQHTQANVAPTQHTQTNTVPPTPPQISAPSISSAAMLVELSISTWTGRKLDKRASKEVIQSNHADAGIATVNNQRGRYSRIASATTRRLSNVFST